MRLDFNRAGSRMKTSYNIMYRFVPIEENFDSMIGSIEHLKPNFHTNFLVVILIIMLIYPNLEALSVVERVEFRHLDI